MGQLLTFARLLNHFVGSREQRRRHVKTERGYRVAIDNKLVLSRLLDGAGILPMFRRPLVRRIAGRSVVRNAKEIACRVYGAN
jgi:hypothetical protein